VSERRAAGEAMEAGPGSLAEYFDGWYADMTTSPVKDEIQQRHLGLPPHLLSTSLLGWAGIAEAVAALRAFHEEGVAAPLKMDLTRRVMASATAP
jgi:hypothetical protein